MRTTLFFLFSIFSMSSFSQEEPYKSNQTYTYEQTIAEYTKLSEKHRQYCSLQDFGPSDYGLPISVFFINKAGKFYPREFVNKTVFLINNAIHPGEPEGVDACIKLSKELLTDTSKIPDNVIIAIIPMYNIGGAHNRNCCSRTNQNGPVEYGFRGNSKNLDLNRDFIKADSKNTLTFYKIFHTLQPDVFIDTHTSNGADYQYVMTLITSQLNKMNSVLSDYVSKKMQPELYSQMEKKGFPMIPYVNTLDETPESGIVDYLETPRYSTGYTNLFNTISFVAETHMLKPFDQRVEATYELLKIMIDFMEVNHKEIKEVKTHAEEKMQRQEHFALNWKLDTTKFSMIPFMGYEAEYKKSEVTGLNRLFYNQKKPYTREVKYYNTYTPTDSVQRPEYYIIPQAWDNVISKMRQSQVKVYALTKDVQIEVEAYSIINFGTTQGPYEGHYLHSSVEVEKATLKLNYRKGDFVIPTRNKQVRFIIETLEPQAIDSYLSWNFFDAVLQQKEWFSAYVFEDEAKQILEENPDLKKAFEAKKKSDSEFASNAFAQLYFIYKGSDHYEPTHNRYPVTRYMKEFENGMLEEVLTRF